MIKGLEGAGRHASVGRARIGNVGPEDGFQNGIAGDHQARRGIRKRKERL